MRSVRHNALAGPEQLGNQELMLQEVEPDTVVGLAIGDFPSGRRRRLCCMHPASMRLVEPEPGLIRLALDFLQRNADHRGGAPGSPKCGRQGPLCRHLKHSVRDTGRGVGNACRLDQPWRAATAPFPCPLEAWACKL